jgi:hypothetical protein
MSRIERIPSRQAFGLRAVRAAAAVLAGALCVPVHAQDTQKAVAVLNVVVRVPRVIHLNVTSRPQEVEVTPADIARGYVEASFPMRLSVLSNARDGYSLTFTNVGPFFALAEVSGLGRDVQLRSSTVSVPRAASGRGLQTDAMQLAVRLSLSAAARPGHYAWPIQVAVLSL